MRRQAQNRMRTRIDTRRCAMRIRTIRTNITGMNIKKGNRK
jgi:hypothetical protein